MGDQTFSRERTAPGSPDERAAAIVAFDLTWPVEDAHLDTICGFVAGQCGAPVALVTLVDQTELRVLGKAGTDLAHAERTSSPCSIAMTEPGITVLKDVRADPRYAAFPLVLGGPSLGFYAAAPLVTPEGLPLGTLCIWDRHPRDDLSDSQKDMLRLMAAAVMDRLLLRRARRTEQLAVKDVRQALEDSEWRFRLLADTMPQMVWSARADGFSDYFNERWYEFTGQPAGSSEGRGWEASLHPDDRERTAKLWQESLETGAPFEIEYRLQRADGDYRWILTRSLAMRAPNGRIMRWFGTCTDIHDHKVEQEERDLISQELAHRIKNIFAVISGLIGLSARAAPDALPFAEALRDRILALGRAHDFVRPYGQSRSRSGDGLHGLLHEIFAPYEDDNGHRIAISGENIDIDDRSATPLALAFHEVVTNAAKYGALSVPEGQASLHTRRDGDHLDMLWQERGGPAIFAATQKSGFGSRLLELSIQRQLGGSYEQLWEPEGLTIRLRIPLSAFSR